MQPWHEIYERRLGDGYYNYFKERYKPFLNALNEELVSPGDRIIEIGCGMANSTRFLFETTPPSVFNSYSVLDEDPIMLGYALKNLNNLSLVKAYKANVLDMIDLLSDEMSVDNFEFTFAHSHGLLEHFNDGQIKDIVKKAGMIASKQIHYVPTNRYEAPSRGDERLLSVEHWENLIQSLNFKSFKMKTFNEGKDLILILE